MSISKNVVFDFFRYQILPKKRVQLELFGQQISLQDLVSKKNEFFETTILKSNPTFYDSFNAKLRHKVIYNEDNIIVIRLGKHKEITLINDNFEEEVHDNLPSVLIIIDNDPSEQKIAISRDFEAFTDSFVVSNILQENFCDFLNQYNLEVIVAPILDKNDFWDLINRYENQITQLKFNLIKPNLANISGTFKDEIRELTDSTNSLVTKVELNAPKDSVLENIDQQNERITALVDYSIQGGSEDITIRVKNMRKSIKTNKTIKKIEVDSIELSGNATSVAEAYKRIIKE